jgi:hypothetical protein
MDLRPEACLICDTLACLPRYSKRLGRRAMYEFTCQLASMQPPPVEMQQLLGAMQGNRKAMDQFAQMNAGTLSPAQFFAPENLGAIMSAVGAR